MFTLLSLCDRHSIILHPHINYVQSFGISHGLINWFVLSEVLMVQRAKIECGSHLFLLYIKDKTLLYLSLVINWEFVEKLWLQFWFSINLGMEIEVFWYVTLCWLVNSCHWMASSTRIPEFSVALLWKCQILYSQSIFKGRM